MSVNNLTVIPEAPRLSLDSRTAGLKMNSCSFSNFERLTTIRDEERGGICGNMNGEVLREMMPARRGVSLQMSKSTNFLQSYTPSSSAYQLMLPIKPQNRLRSSNILMSTSLLEVDDPLPEQCSRCSSLLSLAADGSSTESRYSLNVVHQTVEVAAPTTQPSISCKLCLGEVKSDQMMTLISQCQCTFCTDVSRGKGGLTWIWYKVI